MHKATDYMVWIGLKQEGLVVAVVVVVLASDRSVCKI